MADITTIPTEEMINDYYASLLDRDTCQRLLVPARIALAEAIQDGVALGHAKKTTVQLQERVDGNQHIMDTIRVELERRGELPDVLPR
jgi:hypothetical protein